MPYKKALALVILAFCASALAAAEIPPVGSMFCYHSDGSVSSRSVNYAHAYKGGIVYASDPGEYMTTEHCIAHLPPAVSIKHAPPMQLQGTIYCGGDLVAPFTYYGYTASAELVAGVWTWTELGSADVFVASVPCEVLIQP